MDWSDEEVDFIVADYFAMLADDLDEKPYNKAEHNRELRKAINRSRGSIEFKHQNISAILLGLGQPWISGYKPAANFQNALVDGILRWLNAKGDWLEPRIGSLESPGNRTREAPSLWIAPPPTLRNEPSPVSAEFMAKVGKKFDAAKRDEANRALGTAGEQLILDHERRSLLQAGQEKLAAKIRWTSVQDGDGYGYDIHSYESDGRDKLIEVKTTNGWERTPFHISRNELEVSKACHENWYLVRLWNFARQPRAFALRPPLENHAELTPTSFLASLN